MTPRYDEKSCFCTFFHVQPKHQNGHIFVDIEGFRPYLSKPSYRAPKWALMVRLIQKERLKSPQKSPILENQAIWVIFGHFGQSFPRQDGPPEKKYHLESGLNQRDRATGGFVGVYTHRKPGKMGLCLIRHHHHHHVQPRAITTRGARRALGFQLQGQKR